MFVAYLMIIIMYTQFKNVMVATFVTLLLADYDGDGDLDLF